MKIPNKIFISHGDRLSGLEYTFLNLCKKTNNSIWFIISEKKSESLLFKELDSQNIRYIRVLSKKIKYLPYFHIILLYYKLSLLILRYPHTNIYSSGIIPVFISRFAPISQQQKFIIIRNDIRRFNKFKQFIFSQCLYKSEASFTNNIFNYRYLSRYLKGKKCLFTFEDPLINENLSKNRLKVLENRKDLIEIALISSMRPIKNPKSTSEFINLITALRSDIRFNLIGSGHEYYIKNDLSEKSLNRVKFLGTKSRSECIHFLSVSHYFLSLSLSEGCPNAVIEAMSLGLPCILSNISAHIQLSSNSSNYIVDLENLDDYVKQLSKSLSFDDAIGHRSIASLSTIKDLNKNFPTLSDAIKDYN